MEKPAPADLSRLHVLVPLHGLAEGKTRLGMALDAEERETLVLGMFVHALATLRDWPPCRQVHVITADPAVADVSRRAGATVVDEPVDGDLNAALRAGRHAAVAAGASAILILPADLPLLSRSGLDALLDAADAALAAGSGRAIVVICPSDARNGTNALLLSPAGVIEPRFGEASLEAHVRAAAAADASLQLVLDATLGFDLDVPDDLERLDAARLLQLVELGSQALAAAEML